MADSRKEFPDLNTEEERQLWRNTASTRGVIEADRVVTAYRRRTAKARRCDRP